MTTYVIGCLVTLLIIMIFIWCLSIGFPFGNADDIHPNAFRDLTRSIAVPYALLAIIIGFVLAWRIKKKKGLEHMKLTELVISDTKLCRDSNLDTLVIRELKTNELEEVFHIVKQLRTSLTLQGFIETVTEMTKNGYRTACLTENGRIVTYAGFARILTLYGDHIWVYDLVTDEKSRSKGYGRLMLTYIENLARENSLKCVALSSRLEREDAHRFYEDTMNFKKASYLYRKEWD